MLQVSNYHKCSISTDVSYNSLTNTSVKRPSTMREELTSDIIHPCAPTALAIQDISPTFKACHLDGVECQVCRVIRKS